MTESNISNHILKRAENRLQICKTLQMHGSLTRSEIAERCGIRKNSIGSLIEDLQAKGFLANRNNRKRMPLELDSSSRQVLSIDLYASFVNLAAVNLKGEILHRNSCPLNSGSRQGYIDSVINAALNFSKEHCEGLIGLGISIPAIIDYGSGTCIAANNLPDFNNVPLQSIFGSHFNCPVSVMNCVDASLHSFDRLTNKSGELKNALFIDIVSGVGTSIMIDGKIVFGSNSMAGEIGQIKPCGQTKTLDELCSIDGILRDASSTSGRKLNSVSEFLKVLETDKNVQKMFKEKAALIAEPIIFGLGFLDPDAIIFSNQPKEFYNRLIKHLEYEIKNRMSLLNAKFMISSENNSIIGSALKVIDNVFADPDFDSKFC